MKEQVEEGRSSGGTFPGKNFFLKMRGGSPSPARASTQAIMLAWLGGFIAISILGYMTVSTHTALVLGSFGASCVLVFGFPESPFSQPRNVIGGHVLSSLVGLLFLHFLGPQWWSMALALATAISVMQITRTVHPPAGSNPLIVFLSAAGWDFLFTPTALGACVLVIFALGYNNLDPKRRYPQYWV